MRRAGAPVATGYYDGRNVHILIAGSALGDDSGEAACCAVSEGHARSVSEWVSEAMAQRRDRDARLAVMRRLLHEYEAEHGFISDEEIAEQAQQDRDAVGSYRADVQQAG